MYLIYPPTALEIARQRVDRAWARADARHAAAQARAARRAAPAQKPDAVGPRRWPEIVRVRSVLRLRH